MVSQGKVIYSRQRKVLSSFCEVLSMLVTDVGCVRDNQYTRIQQEQNSLEINNKIPRQCALLILIWMKLCSVGKDDQMNR